MKGWLDDRRFWIGLLIVGLLCHVLAALWMPLGLDAHLHAAYVTDGMADGEESIDWGPVRPDLPDASTPSEVDANGRWSAWHLWMEGWLTWFGPSTSTLHAMGLFTGLAALFCVHVCTRYLWGEENALRLTAISAIHPPLIRAAGRCYQEGAVLLVITLAFTALILGERQRRAGNRPWWWAGTLLCLGLLLDLKGLPLEGMWVAALLLGLWSSFDSRLNGLDWPRQWFLVGVVGIGTMLFALLKNGVSVVDQLEDIIVSIIVALFLVVIVFVFAGMGLVGRKLPMAKAEGEAALIQQAALTGLGVVLGYVAALWVIEAHALGLSFTEVWVTFRYNPRYASLLLVPFWWAWMARDEGVSIVPDEGRHVLFAGTVVLLLLLNAHILNDGRVRHMELIGEELADEVERGDEILFIAPAPLAMHKLYTMQLTLDPTHELDVLAHWRSPDSTWQDELLDCDTLGTVDWIIVHPSTEIELDDAREVSIDGADPWSYGAWSIECDAET